MGNDLKMARTPAGRVSGEEFPGRKQPSKGPESASVSEAQHGGLWGLSSVSSRREKAREVVGGVARPSGVSGPCKDVGFFPKHCRA